MYASLGGSDVQLQKEIEVINMLNKNTRNLYFVSFL